MAQIAVETNDLENVVGLGYRIESIQAGPQSRIISQHLSGRPPQLQPRSPTANGVRLDRRRPPGAAGRQVCLAARIQPAHNGQQLRIARSRPGDHHAQPHHQYQQQGQHHQPHPAQRQPAPQPPRRQHRHTRQENSPGLGKQQQHDKKAQPGQRQPAPPPGRGPAPPGHHKRQQQQLQPGHLIAVHQPQLRQPAIQKAQIHHLGTRGPGHHHQPQQRQPYPGQPQAHGKAPQRLRRLQPILSQKIAKRAPNSRREFGQAQRGQRANQVSQGHQQQVDGHKAIHPGWPQAISSPAPAAQTAGQQHQQGRHR